MVGPSKPAPRKQRIHKDHPDAWVTACPDWAERIRKHESLCPVLPLYSDQATRAVAIFDKLRLPDVPDKPLLRDAAGDWFRDIVRAVFGSYSAAHRKRFIQEVFCMVPKKSSKTSYGAALMLVAVIMSERPRAEFLLVAPTQEVADLAFSQAVGMVEADDVLVTKFHIQPHTKKITYRTTGAFLKVKSFDPKIVTGTKPAGILLDEIHVIAEAPDADRVIGQLRGGIISQPEAFFLMITTQSERPPSGVFKAELTKARAVRDGKFRAPLLPIIYEFPPGVDWRDPQNWTMVLPNEGRSVSVARLLPDYQGAIEAGEGELRRWASQHLNVEIGLALISDHWPGSLFWEARKREGLTLDVLLATCDMVALGIDAGGPADWMGLTVLGRENETRHWLCWSHAWVHRIALDRFKGEAQKWLDFEADGDLTIVDELGPDVDQLVALVMKVWESDLLFRVGLDPAGSAKVLHEALMLSGEMPESLFVGIGQGWHLIGIMKLVERRLASGTLWHSGSRMMNYCVGNCRVVTRGNATLITKEASKGKIDPVMALLDAGECLAIAPAPIDIDAMIAPG
jgi:phage terminase large subunit-like protein